MKLVKYSLCFLSSQETSQKMLFLMGRVNQVQREPLLKCQSTLESTNATCSGRRDLSQTVESLGLSCWAGPELKWETACFAFSFHVLAMLGMVTEACDRPALLGGNRNS